MNAEGAGKLRITGLVIMRDAASDIGPCLLSMREQVDELIAVDTGSRDDTVAVAEKCGARVLHYEWKDDFAAARNFAIDHATGDWILFLDSDEALTEETRGNLRGLVEISAEQGKDSIYVRRENVDGEDKPIDFMGDFSMRIFLRDDRLRYRDPVHEYLAWEDSHDMASAMTVPGELCIRHRGYAPDRIDGKRRRDLDILERMREEEPERKKLYMDYYMAALYRNLGQLEKAMEHVRAALASGDMPAYRTVDVWRTWVDCMQLKGDAEGMEEAVRYGLEHYLYAPDPYVQAGVWKMNRGDFGDALSLILLGMSFIDSFGRLRPMEANSMAQLRPNLFANLSVIYYELGRMEDARRMARLAGKGKGAVGEKGEDMREFSDYLPPRAKTVLHYGCGKGLTARRFRGIRPECRYIGVVDRQEEAPALSPWVSDVFVGTPGGGGFDLLGVDAVDCIVYEGRSVSLLTPEILREQAEHLAPGGQMIAVLDNPGYLGRILGRFLGKPQKEVFEGDVERFCAMAEQAGLSVNRVRPVEVPEDVKLRELPETQALSEAILAWQKAQKVTFRNPWASCFLLRMTRKAPLSSIFVTAWLGEVAVTARVRMSEPYGFLITEPDIQYHAETKGMDLRRARVCEQRIALRQRVSYTSAEQAFQQIGELRKENFLILTEMDDNPSRWRKDYEREFWLEFRGSHACQVSTEPLAEVLRAYNPYVKVFRNELRELPPKREYVKGAPVTVFFGALNREEDWKEILPALNEAAEKYGEQLRFRVLADKAFFGALRTEYKEFVGDDRYYGGRFVPYSVYAEVLHTADISLLPLRDTEFNRTKSDLKFIESAGHGAVALASPTVYASTLRDGETGFLYRSPREFAERLRLLVENPEKRMEMAAAGYAYVRSERLLSQHYEERLAWYRELFQRRDELERGLDARLEAARREYEAQR